MHPDESAGLALLALSEVVVIGLRANNWLRVQAVAPVGESFGAGGCPMSIFTRHSTHRHPAPVADTAPMPARECRHGTALCTRLAAVTGPV